MKYIKLISFFKAVKRVFLAIVCTSLLFSHPIKSSSADCLYSSKLGHLMAYVLSKPWFSYLAGWYTRTRISSLHIPSFIRSHIINMDEVSENSFKTFNDFFIRSLKPEARPIDQSPNSIVSPCDAQMTIITSLSDQTEIMVKGKSFNMATFLSDDKLPSQFKGGTMVIFYLSPRDYHRFHQPFDAQISIPYHIPGVYHSVQPVVFQSGIQPLEVNERKLILFNSHSKNPVAFVAVGAMCVGQMAFTSPRKTPIKKGEELGYFSFGGSTIVLLFPAGYATIDQTLHGKHVRMGEKIGILTTQC